MQQEALWQIDQMAEFLSPYGEMIMQPARNGHDPNGVLVSIPLRGNDNATPLPQKWLEYLLF